MIFKNLHKVQAKIYIFENHLYSKLPLFESFKDKLYYDSYKSYGFGMVLKGTRREGRAEGTTDKLAK